MQNLTPVGPRISEISQVEKKSGVKLKSAPQAIAFGQTNKTSQWTEMRCPTNFHTSMTNCSMQQHLAENRNHSEKNSSGYRNINDW